MRPLHTKERLNHFLQLILAHIEGLGRWSLGSNISGKLLPPASPSAAAAAAAAAARGMCTIAAAIHKLSSPDTKNRQQTAYSAYIYLCAAGNVLHPPRS